MRIETVETYTLDELSPEAREKARDWYRKASAGDTWNLEFIVDDAARMAGLLGFEVLHDHGEWAVYYSLFEQGAGCTMEGRYEHKRGSLAAIMREAPSDSDLHEIARRLQRAQRRAFYQLSAHVRASHHYSHSRAARIEVYNDTTGEEITETEAGETVAEALRDLMDWAYRNLERQALYDMSDEGVDEAIEANEYTFTAEGSRLHVVGSRLSPAPSAPSLLSAPPQQAPASAPTPNLAPGTEGGTK